jgi:hypothetical protein
LVLFSDMKRISPGLVSLLLVPWLNLVCCQPLCGRILDNFDDNVKTAWQDFTFVPGFGIPVETNGQFKFTQPPAGQAIFSASTKVSETFTIQDGRTVEFRVDVVQGGGKDSFAVLAFIPTTSSASTLAGYGLAKSTTDILVTKGIGKYFYNENPTPAIKNDNITLVLSMTGKGTNVVINARVLDKDNNNAVIFDLTFVDTPAADVLSDGTDSPAAPYFGSGNFVLYLYQDYSASAPEDPYQVTYDNAEVFVLDNSVLDDFNDNVKTAWQDFTFVPGFGIPEETGGQFKFTQPPAGQAIFSASTKTSRAFDLVDGERLEFRVDIAQGGGKDSFAVLAFIPTTSSASTLAGYGFAKSTTDILITKGIGKYFYNQDPAPAIKQDNTTLVLSMTGKGTNVVINARVLDKDNNNAVIFDQTVVDTPAADILADGTDSPAAPYFGSGNFVLYLYQDYSASAPENPYQVTYDNAEVSAPPLAANTPPVISDVLPANYANFLSASNQISFKVTDDKPLIDSKISVTLNGTRHTTTNGLTVSGSGTTRTASLGGLEAQMDYTAVLSAEDSDAATTSQTLYFDTFAETNSIIEIEDYNFESGKFIDNPVPTPEGSGPASNAYSLQTGVQGVDFNDTRTTPRPQDTLYRPNDPVRMQHSLDNGRQKYAAAGGTAASVYDYDVGDIAAGEWLNYTRTFPPGSYQVYLREALVNMASGESVLEQVTSDPTQANQTTKIVGSFLGARTGFQYRNFALTDGTGQNKVIARLSGPVTIRLRQVTADPGDGARDQNYLIFIPVADQGLQRATVTSLSPAPDSVTETVTPSIRVELQNRDTSVSIGTIKLELNGQTLSPTVVSNATGATVTNTLTPLPASGATNTARIRFQDNLGVEMTNTWSFVITYQSLDPANRQAGPGSNPGFKVRVVQAPAGSNLENSLMRAEDQLSSASTIPKVVDTNFVAQLVNYNKRADQVAGIFAGDVTVPGIDVDVNGDNDFAVEILAYLDLSAGIHRFGVISDDGYKISAGSSFTDLATPALAFHNGGPANETFDFVVPQTGLYPLRMVWYERGGAAYAEWFSVNTATDEKILINDTTKADSVKAYYSVTPASTIQLESAASIPGTFANDPAAVIDATAKTIRVPLSGSSRFYRLRYNSSSTAAPSVRILNIRIESQTAVLSYQIN